MGLTHVLDCARRLLTIDEPLGNQFILRLLHCTLDGGIILVDLDWVYFLFCLLC